MRLGSFNTPLVISVTSIAVAAIVTAAQLPEMAAAVLTPGLKSDPTLERLDEYLAGHDEDVETYRDRFDGRSLFFKPRPPRRSMPRVADNSPSRPEPPPPPPPKTRPPYGGPTVLFVLGDEVWFHNGLKVTAGEEGEGVKVLETDAPWSVTVEHDGWEYDIDLFQRFEFPSPPRNQRPLPGLESVISQ